MYRTPRPAYQLSINFLHSRLICMVASVGPFTPSASKSVARRYKA